MIQLDQGNMNFERKADVKCTMSDSTLDVPNASKARKIRHKQK